MCDLRGSGGAYVSNTPYPSTPLSLSLRANSKKRGHGKGSPAKDPFSRQFVAGDARAVTAQQVVMSCHGSFVPSRRTFCAGGLPVTPLSPPVTIENARERVEL